MKSTQKEYINYDLHLKEYVRNNINKLKRELTSIDDSSIKAKDKTMLKTVMVYEISLSILEYI